MVAVRPAPAGLHSSRRGFVRGAPQSRFGAPAPGNVVRLSGGHQHDARPHALAEPALGIGAGVGTLWTIHRCFGRVVFLFFTDEQAQAHAKGGLLEAYADLYFEVLQRHDEFRYVRRDRFGIEFDSKENFDKNYRSNWFFYDR
jgi:hypothetical protein